MIVTVNVSRYCDKVHYHVSYPIIKYTISLSFIRFFFQKMIGYIC